MLLERLLTAESLRINQVSGYADAESVCPYSFWKFLYSGKPRTYRFLGVIYENHSSLSSLKYPNIIALDLSLI